jgi:hypothetical protein
MPIKRALPRETAKRIGPFSRRTRKASAIRQGAAKHRSAIINSETLVKGKGMAEALLPESGYDGKVEAMRDAFVRASSARGAEEDRRRHPAGSLRPGDLISARGISRRGC